MAKFTDADVTNLASTIRRENGRFAFLTGAGCSLSAGIPLANTLCTEICEKYPNEIDHLTQEQRCDYGLCMGELSLDEREQILKPYLENVKINWAHIALATLIQKKLISRVLTFNFDSVLAHACGLLGIYPATYDFGVSPTNRVNYLAKPCIVHLHGQGSGAAMMNDSEETQTHAKELKPLLEDTLTHLNLVVIGYSGAADNVFETLSALYDGRKRLFWIGHADEPEEYLRPFFKKPFCKYIGGADADEFLIKLAQQLNCFPPQVFDDPAGHLLSEMKDVAPYPLNNTGTTDILQNTIERLNKHQNVLRLTKDQSAVMRNDPTEIDLTDSSISAEVKAWAHIEAGYKHFTTAKETNSDTEYQEAVKQYEAALNIQPRNHEALNYWGIALYNLAQLRQDPEGLKSAIAKYEEALHIKPNMYDAFFNWGLALFELATKQQDPEGFKKAIAKYKEALYIKPDMHEALKNWGGTALRIWYSTKNPAYLDQASEVLKKAEALKPEDCYNGACLAAIKCDDAGCEERLLRAKAAKTLPTREHLETDKDLDNMRDKLWFIEFLKGL